MRELGVLALVLRRVIRALHIAVGDDPQQRRPDVDAIVVGEIEQAVETRDWSRSSPCELFAWKSPGSVKTKPKRRLVSRALTVQVSKSPVGNATGGSVGLGRGKCHGDGHQISRKQAARARAGKADRAAVRISDRHHSSGHPHRAVSDEPQADASSGQRRRRRRRCRRAPERQPHDRTLEAGASGRPPNASLPHGAACCLLGGCAPNGDFGRVRPELVNDDIHDWVGRDAAVASAGRPPHIPLTDDERLLRDLAYPLIEPPYDRNRFDSVLAGIRAVADRRTATPYLRTCRLLVGSTRLSPLGSIGLCPDHHRCAQRRGADRAVLHGRRPRHRHGRQAREKPRLCRHLTEAEVRQRGKSATTRIRPIVAWVCRSLARPRRRHTAMRSSGW